MHRYLIPFAAMALMAGSGAARAADLTVTISGLNASQATVYTALHDGAEGFPGERAPLSGIFARPSGDSITMVFKDMAPGRYAVAAFQDMDGDAALTTNLLGIPGEPFGFSRDARGSFGPPSFADAAVEIGNADMAITLTLVE